MPNLEDLNLMSNPWLDVTVDVIGDFLSLSGLQVLKLGDMHHGNVLNEKGMQMLAELDGLKSLSLAFFNWSTVKPILNKITRNMFGTDWPLPSAPFYVRVIFRSAWVIIAHKQTTRDLMFRNYSKCEQAHGPAKTPKA